MRGSIVVLDFGGQYAHLIANRVRRLGMHSEVFPPEVSASILEKEGVAGIILSGGPQSVYEEGSPQADPAILSLGVPVLGLCYGFHWMTHTLGGIVAPGTVKEYGRTRLSIVDGGGDILSSCGSETVVWMSHGDMAHTLPPGCRVTAKSDDCPIAAFEDSARRLYALQFHPEVTHTEKGMEILQRFVSLCDGTPWSLMGMDERLIEEAKRAVGERKVFLLVSGGVDSMVAFALLNRAIGQERVYGLLIDTGLMRKNEVTEIRASLDALGFHNLHIEDASAMFFSSLEGQTDPEAKRRIIGDTFLSVQRMVSERLSLRMEDGWMLGQGTIYPDTIETGGTKHSDHIKTHHNRVPAIQALIDAGLVCEPLKDLYKDEVRMLGEQLGLPHDLVWRHPFPGPGLGVRILCADHPEHIEDDGSITWPHMVLPVRSVGVQGDGRTYRHAVSLFSEHPYEISDAMKTLATSIPNTSRLFNRVLLCMSHTKPFPLIFTSCSITRDRAELLRDADEVCKHIIRSRGLYEACWQFPVVLLPFGVVPEHASIVLRPVHSTDAMTADAFIPPPHVLSELTAALLAVPSIDAVFLDLTSKPPATIEWE